MLASGSSIWEGKPSLLVTRAYSVIVCIATQLLKRRSATTLTSSLNILRECASVSDTEIASDCSSLTTLSTAPCASVHRRCG